MKLATSYLLYLVGAVLLSTSSAFKFSWTFISFGCDICIDQYDTETPLKVENGDTVTLSFDATRHDVWQFKSAADFDNCNFEGATVLKARDSLATEAVTFDLPTDKNGIIWIGCSVGAGSHCSAEERGMKFAYQVTGKPKNLRG